MKRRVSRVVGSTALFSASSLLLSIETAHADEIGATISNVTTWVQGLLVSLGVLGFVLGAAFFIFDHTVGGQERGKQFMVASVGGVVLGLLAGPIVHLAAGFVAR